MRKYLNHLYVMLAAISIALLNTSCEKEEVEIRVPQVTFEITFGENGRFLANGETLTIERLSIDTDNSSAGIRITKVEYLLDGVSIANTTTSPFRLSHRIQNMSIGTHTLTFRAEIKGDGYSDTTVSSSLEIYVLREPFLLSFDINFDDTSRQVRNGDTLSGTVGISETTLNATITRVEFYWDETLIAGTSIEPFAFSYTITNASVGAHKFTAVIYTEDDQIGGLVTRIPVDFTVVE